MSSFALRCRSPPSSSLMILTFIELEVFMPFDIKCCGARIRTLRENARINQSELANILHITNTHLNRIESGVKGASLDLLLEISDQFHVSLDFLVTGRDIQQVSWKTINYFLLLQN